MNSTTATKIKEAIKNCKNDISFFVERFCKVKHPTAGVIPFRLFSYQRKCLKACSDHRFLIFSKVRQCGISTLTGAYALWMCMMFKSKTILITSKTDRDAKEFLDKNIKFVYSHLPKWMRLLWTPVVLNEHEIGFANGSKIKSLPSGPEVLRQYSSSLNIIDEASVTPHMDEMWASGAPTLSHGGQCIVVATSRGMGNWYWKTWTDALENKNDFHPIVIEWWDMDWKIEYIDDRTNKLASIAPLEGIRKCETPEEVEKYGQYWSPWLDVQYRQLVAKGGNSLFRQEILRDFLGSGNTVLDREALIYAKTTVVDDYKVVDIVDYVHPITNESYVLEFKKSLWVWEEPQPGHTYSIGVDISSGEALDYSGIEVFDITDGVQVAELQIKCQPRTLAVMADYIGRWYNNAFLVPERTGMGITVCQDLELLTYYNIFRKNMTPQAKLKPTDYKNLGPIGFNTTGAGKPIINKALIDNIGDEAKYKVKSQRLLHQLETYVHLGGVQTGAEKGTLNDDLVISAGLALLGNTLAVAGSGSILLPFNSNPTMISPLLSTNARNISKVNDHKAVAPITIDNTHMPAEVRMDEELERFSASLLTPRTESSIYVVNKRAVLSRTRAR